MLTKKMTRLQDKISSIVNHSKQDSENLQSMINSLRCIEQAIQSSNDQYEASIEKYGEYVKIYFRLQKKVAKDEIIRKRVLNKLRHNLGKCEMMKTKISNWMTECVEFKSIVEFLNRPETDDVFS
jgi:chromosome segregation ATPase